MLDRIRPVLVAAWLVALWAGAPSAASPARSKTASGAGPRPAGHVESGQWIDGPACKLYVEILGARTGVPLVVVNGGPGEDHSYLHCSSAWDSLARYRTVVFYDQRGVGRSGRLMPGALVTNDQQVADLEAIRRHLGAQTLDLLGHSYGGYLAIAYTVQYPTRVSHLILCDSASPQWSSTMNILFQVYPERAAVMDSIAYPSPDSVAYNGWFRQFMSMMFHQPEKRAEFLAHPEWLRVWPAINAALRDDMRGKDLRLPFMQFGYQSPGKTLILTGRFDFVSTPGVAYEIHGDLNGSLYRVFENSGHFPFFEEPREFANSVEVFLDTQ
jgi:proline iminopeptidase